MFKTPRFWYAKRPNLFARILQPLSWVYTAASKIYQSFKTPSECNAKIVCVGNVTVGGTGKTPLTVTLFEILKANGKAVAIFSKGYGRTLKTPLMQVKPTKHTAQDVGDEPLMMAVRGCDVWVSDDRAQALAELSEQYNVILLDDGLQDSAVIKDVSLLVVDGDKGFGNRLQLPAGPLRAPLPDALNKVQAVFITGNDKYGVEDITGKAKPVFQGGLRSTKKADTAEQAVAFAGIGFPEKFYQTLKDDGVEILATFDFPDHYVYTSSDLDKMIDAYKGRVIYTTEKDYIRIPLEYKKYITPYPVSLKINDENAFVKWLLSAI